MKNQTFCGTLILVMLSFFVKAQNNYKEISLPQLMKKKQQGDTNMVIVDVRTNGEYYDSASLGKQSNIGRIRGAIHIELRTLQQDPKAVKQLDKYKDKEIYLICSHSYRSRSASNILLKNGFTHVNNVNGGMTEWFRRYDDLEPYKKDFYETANPYKNISSAEVAAMLFDGANPLLIGISNTPKFFYDSATIKLYKYFPLFKNAVYFNVGDSLKVLDLVIKERNRPVVLYNMVNNGAAELAGWLTKKGVTDASYLIGNNNYFYEYIVNKQLIAKASPFIVQDNAIEFVTAVNYCSRASEKNTILTDIRHDSIFNTIRSGIKYDYSHAKSSINFFAARGASEFELAYPDKMKKYVLLSENGIDGLELADALTKKGYKIGWLMGGMQRLDWYTINVEDFGCKEILFP